MILHDITAQVLTALGFHSNPRRLCLCKHTSIKKKRKNAANDCTRKHRQADIMESWIKQRRDDLGGESETERPIRKSVCRFFRRYREDVFLSSF